MKAQFIKGQDPKQAMGIGQAKQKERLISMFDDPATYPTNEDTREQFKYMVRVIADSDTTVFFDPEINQVKVTRPKSLTNAFFFNAIYQAMKRKNSDAECFIWDNPELNTMEAWWG